MKIFTANLIKFSVLLFILTVIFRYTLSTMLSNEQFVNIWFVAIAYGLIIFMLGWFFGKNEKKSLPIYDVGFRFHLATYVICNLVGELWYIFEFQSKYEHIKSIHLTALFWGIGLAIHFILYLITRKNAIKGLKRSEIFD